MPGMDGYQLATEVSQRYPEIKIQLASGFSGNLQQNLDERNSKLHEAILHKPYNKDQLLLCVRNLLDS